MTTAVYELADTAWDVIVIGAGVAGCVVARQSALLGLKTLLVEGRSFPRPKVCGGCLSAQAIHVLEAIGLSHIIRELKGEPFEGVALKSGNLSAFLRLPRGLSVTRQSLDWALIRAASQAGVVVQTETLATVKPELSQGVRRVALQHHQQLSYITAQVVVCADGLLRTSLQSLEQMRACHSANSRVGIGLVMAQGALDHSVAGQFPRNQITMLIERSGYVGFTWAEGGQLSVAGAVCPAFLKSAGSPSAAAGRILAANGIGLPESSSWRGTPSLTVSPRWNAAERIFVIGDAAGYVEPFTGEGMAAALAEAVALTPLIFEAVKGWHPTLAQAWQRQHQIKFQRRQRICRMVAIILRRPWMSRLALKVIQAFPLPANYLANCVARPIKAVS